MQNVLEYVAAEGWLSAGGGWRGGGNRVSKYIR